MTSGFIYKWHDTKKNLYYIGRHEGRTDDGYIASGTIIKNVFKKRPEDFVREILWESNETSSSEIQQQEEYFLAQIPDDQLYWGENRKYYNQTKHSGGYTSVNNPMLFQANIDRMIATQIANGTRSTPYSRSIAKYGEEKVLAMMSEQSRGNTHGRGNKNKAKSEDHKRKISETITRMHSDPTNTMGKRLIADKEELITEFERLGVKEYARILGITRKSLHDRIRYARKTT